MSHTRMHNPVHIVFSTKNLRKVIPEERPCIRSAIRIRLKILFRA